MKKFGLGLITIAMIMVMAASAGAVATYNPGGLGDALIFPYFDVNRGTNYVVIHNTSGDWIQAHIRFRTAILSIEARDFDIILSPYDVWVFSIDPVEQAETVIRGTTIENVTTWQINQTLDPKNFSYIPGLANETLDNNYHILSPKIPLYPLERNLTTGKFEEDTKANPLYTEASARADLSRGYIEVIAEAVLVGCTPIDVPTTTWRWQARGLRGVGNVLAGSLFIPAPQTGNGLAYNAVALADFRTNIGTNALIYHRDGDPYADRGVILHDDNSKNFAASYCYNFFSDAGYERAVSYNNTWGPTLADGDDLNAFLDDGSDLQLAVINSVDEVEDALWDANGYGNALNAHYFDNNDVKTAFTLTFPTKHHHYPTPFGMAAADVSFTNDDKGYELYRDFAHAQNLIATQSVAVTIWDIFEQSDVAINQAITSPQTVPVAQLILGQESNIFDIDFLKSSLQSGSRVHGFTEGQVFIWYTPSTGVNNFNIPAVGFVFEDWGNGEMGLTRPYYVNPARFTLPVGVGANPGS